MAHRCINAFWYADRMIAGGALVNDDDPILATHAAHFVVVEEPATGRGETANADRQRRRPGRSGKEHVETPPVDEQPAADPTDEETPGLYGPVDGDDNPDQ